MLFRELVLNQSVEEFVVEGLVPGLAGEHLAEVRATLTHDRLEADHGRALGCHRHVLGRCREPDDVRPVVGEHRLDDFNMLNVLSGVKKLVSGATSQAECARFL